MGRTLDGENGLGLDSDRGDAADSDRFCQSSKSAGEFPSTDIDGSTVTAALGGGDKSPASDSANSEYLRQTKSKWRNDRVETRL